MIVRDSLLVDFSQSVAVGQEYLSRCTGNVSNEGKRELKTENAVAPAERGCEVVNRGRRCAPTLPSREALFTMLHERGNAR